MEELENSMVKFWHEDGILHSRYKQPIELTLTNAPIIIALRHEISANEKQYWCYDLTHLISFSKEAKDYAEIHGQDYLNACAVITGSHVAKFIYNSFALFKKVRIPLRAFTTKEAAVAWLKEIKKKDAALSINHNELS